MEEPTERPSKVSLTRFGLVAGRYMNRIIKRDLTLGTAKTLVVLNVLIAIVLVILALNGLMALRWITDWDYVWHLIEFGLLIAMIAMMIAALPGKPASFANLRNFTILFLIYAAFNLVQNLFNAFSFVQDPVTFLVLVVLAAPLNLALSFLAFLPMLFVWTRSLIGEPSTG